MRWRRATLGASSLAILIGGCGPSDFGEPTGSSNDPLTSICGAAPGATTADGYPAYKYCGNFDVYSNDGKNTSSSPASGWIKTGGGFGYQCVEFAKRYFYFRWKVPTGWFIPGAKDMCTTYPSGVSKTQSPKVGDLMVMGAGSCGSDGTFGHVGVINADQGTSWQLAQQNPAGLYNWPKSCALCYLHAASNGGGSTSDPCSTVQYGGYYCGESPQWSGATAGTLYLCDNGVTANKTVCEFGCNVAPPGTNDACVPAPAGSGGTGGASDAGIDAPSSAGTSDAGIDAPSSDAGKLADSGAPWGATGGDSGLSPLLIEPNRNSTGNDSGGCSANARSMNGSRIAAALMMALALALRSRRRR